MSVSAPTAPSAPASLRLVPGGMPVERDVALPDEAHERVARALRGARARTGLGEQQVVDSIAASGFRLGPGALRQAESTGVLELALASALADLYGMTTDCLAGRRLNRQGISSLPAPLL
jgi:hypothetical protein